MVDEVFMRRARRFRSAALAGSPYEPRSDPAANRARRSIPTYRNIPVIYMSTRGNSEAPCEPPRSRGKDFILTEKIYPGAGVTSRTLDIQMSSMDMPRAPTFADSPRITTIFLPGHPDVQDGHAESSHLPYINIVHLRSPGRPLRSTTTQCIHRAHGTRGQKPTARPRRMSPLTPVLRWIAVPSLSTTAIPAIASRSTSTANAPPRCLV